MKRITTKTLSSLLLIFGTVFACLSITSHIFAQPTSAITVIQLPNESDDSDPADSSDDSGPTDDPDSGESTDPDSQTDPDASDDNAEEDDANSDDSEEIVGICYQESGMLGWIVCSAAEFASNFVDNIYNLISNLLIVKPISMDNNSAIYIVWQYARNITNIVVIILLLIVIMSQVTGLGVNNYGIKRILPRLIITIILVNLSFLICSLAVDISNILGANLHQLFTSIKDSMVTNSNMSSALADVNFANIVANVVGGGVVAGLVISAAGGLGSLFWLLLPILVGALISVVTGIITVAGRQAVVALLIMISPLAFVAYLLPNTEKWFSKWKDLLLRMLIFFPMFSFLFGASKLAGWALIAASNGDGIGIIIGLAVQVFPIFFAFTLMKMSGTILGSVNSALRNLASPIQRATGDLSMLNRARSRDQYIMRSGSSGAHLRKYLDYRRELRINDARNTAEARHDHALEAAMTKSSSITGRDKLGNTTWIEKPNRYARNAKTANYWHTKASNAAMAYNNTLSAYGRHFGDAEAQSLAEAHSEAFLDSMAQQFLATNEAQADQDWLLDKYLKAKGDLKNNVYQYNRLIKDAAGGLGHNGESSIMGQVIIGNSNIENRRRTEGRIMINKFGMEKHKLELRGMVFDVDRINDEGFATDENGIPIEDDQYNLLPGKHYTPWQRYIAVHKKTGTEITKEQYDALSDAERDKYRKVRYFDITDDHGNEVQRIFEDDAGYMKEILTDDMYISDPIVRRFLTQIGVAKKEGEKDGLVRKYHSTLRAAVDSSGFSKGHGAGYTQMYTSAANAGLIKNMCDHNVILLQSFAASSKPGNFAQQDAFFIEELDKLFDVAINPEKFSHYFPDQYLNDSTTNNGIRLNGMRLATTTTEDGKTIPKWEEINFNEVDKLDEKTALEYRKNYVKHKMIPKGIGVAVGALERRMSPEVINSLKPGAKDKLDTMRDHLSAIGVMNLNKDIPFTERPDGNKNLFEVPDTDSLRDGVKATQDYIQQEYDITSNQKPTTDTVRVSSRGAINTFNQRLSRSAEADARIERYNDMMDILGEFESYYVGATRNGLGLDVFCADILSLFEERPCLRDYLGDCQNIITEYYNMPRPDRDNFISQVTNHDEFELERINKIYHATKELIYRACNQA